jgi:hypothetical protein
MGHFYHPKTGALIDGDLRDARKVGALPSPTTVLSLLGSYGLTEYFKRQMFEATATTARQPGWDDDTYYEAVKRFADEHGKTARERGGDFHTLVQQFHLSTLGRAAPPEVPAHFSSQYDAYSCWYESNVEHCLMVEETVFGDGYGGRVDLVALLKDGRVAVPDVKTQDRKKRAGFNHYLSWALQLGAYAGAVKDYTPDCLISVIVSSNEPVVLEAYEWPKPWTYYHGLFLGVLSVYCEEKQYFPTGASASP